MSNCTVCNSLITGASDVCLICRWPLGYRNICSEELKSTIEEWAKEIYREVKELRDKVPVQIEGLSEEDLINQEIKGNKKSNTLANKFEKVDKEILSIKESIQRISSFIREQNSENEKLGNQIQSNGNSLIDFKNMIKELLAEQQNQLGEINILKSFMANSSSPSSPVSLTFQKQLVPFISNNEDLNYAPEELDLLNEYDRHFQDILNYSHDQAKSVSIDDDTFARLRDGNNSNITFKFDRKGNYLIIVKGDYRYLVPNKQKKFIEHMYTTMKAIYNCDRYDENYQNLRLIKPALVLENSINSWQLSQKGTLEFI